MKEIWIFNHYAVPPSNNSQYRHNQFAKYLKKKGYEVTIFFSSQIHNSEINLIKDNSLSSESYIDGIKYVAIKTRRYKDSGKQRILNMIDYYRGLKKYVKKNNKLEPPDIIYASSVHLLALLAGISIAKKYNVLCVCEVKDLWPMTLVEMGRLDKKSIITKLLYSMEKYIYKKSDKIIFTMSGGKQYILDHGWDKQVDINKIHQINNGVSLSDYEFNKNEFFFENNCFKEENFKVTYTGSIGQANMVQTIIEAAKILDEESDANIVFEIFGDGLEKDSIMSFVEKEDIKNVNFYGKVKPEYIPSILAESKVNLIVGKDSSLYKYGFSQNKFFTYLASKKPMISNRKVHSILEDSGSGLIVDPENPRSLAEGILEVYNMSDVKYQSYCANAFELAKEYDYEYLTNKLIKVLTE